MSTASENDRSSAQLADLSAELDKTAEHDEESTSDAEGTDPTASTATSAASNELHQETSTSDASNATSPPQTAAPSAEDDGEDLVDWNDEEDEKMAAEMEQKTASSEDKEWLHDEQSNASQQDLYGANLGASQSGSLLDARKSPLEQSFVVRSMKDSVMDARSNRDVKGRAVSRWLFRDTVLDSRSEREVLGRRITERRFDDTVLDSRAARAVIGRVIDAREQRLAGTILDARANRTNTQSPLTAANLARRFSPQLLLNPTPPTTGRFFILLGPVPDFAFHECSGLAFRLETETYAEGGAGRNHHFPKHVESENIVFSRGLVFGPGWIQLRRWRESMLDDGPPLRMNGVIVMQNDLGVPICFWRFKNGFPVRWTGPTLKPGSTDLAVEELEIAHEGLKVIDIALAADMLVDSALGMASVMSSSEGSSGVSDGVSAAQSIMTGDVGGLL